MSRRNAARKREVMPDPIFHSKLVSKLVNSVMRNGKKSVAERIVYGAATIILSRGKKQENRSALFSSINEAEKKSILEILKRAINNASPRVEVRSRRVGGSNIQVNNQKDDIEGLLKEVAKLGYEQKELEELRLAVTEDKSKSETPTVTDGETGKWFTRALKEAGKGVVKAGVDVVSSVIVKALGHYTGQP